VQICSVKSYKDRHCSYATVHFQMYEPATGASKQFGAILQHASAPGVLFQAPSSVAAAGPYVTVVRKTLHHCCH